MRIHDKVWDLLSQIAIFYLWNINLKIYLCFQFSSVAQSCPTLCDPMDCSTAGFTVQHQLQELAQTHVQQVSDAILPSHSRSSSLLLPSILPTIRVFTNELFTSGGQSIGVSTSVSILPMNIQDWFPLVLTDLISLQSKGLSRVFSNTTVQKQQFFGTHLSL